jgi:hypothetical protein
LRQQRIFPPKAALFLSEVLKKSVGAYSALIGQHVLHIACPTAGGFCFKRSLETDAASKQAFKQVKKSEGSKEGRIYINNSQKNVHGALQYDFKRNNFGDQGGFFEKPPPGPPEKLLFIPIRLRARPRHHECLAAISISRGPAVLRQPQLFIVSRYFDRQHNGNGDRQKNCFRLSPFSLTIIMSRQSIRPYS